MPVTEKEPGVTLALAAIGKNSNVPVAVLFPVAISAKRTPVRPSEQVYEPDHCPGMSSAVA